MKLKSLFRTSQDYWLQNLVIYMKWFWNIYTLEDLLKAIKLPAQRSKTVAIKMLNGELGSTINAITSEIARVKFGIFILNI